MAVFYRVSFYLLFIMILYSNNVVAGEDEYVKLLEAEAADSRLDQSGQGKEKNAAHNQAIQINKRDWIGECDYIDDVLPSGLAWEEFPSYLKQCSLDAYVFYQRLELGFQHAVYNTYQKIAPTKLSILKKEVLNYFRYKKEQ